MAQQDLEHWFLQRTWVQISTLTSGSLQVTCNSSSVGSNAIFWPLQVLVDMSAYPYIDTHIHVKRNKSLKKIPSHTIKYFWKTSHILFWFTDWYRSHKNCSPKEGFCIDGSILTASNMQFWALWDVLDHKESYFINSLFYDFLQKGAALKLSFRRTH